jgi:hypothetical protein
MALRHEYLIDAVYAYDAASDSGDLEAYGQAEAAYLAALIKAQQDVDICCHLPEETACAACGQEIGDHVYRFTEVANIDPRKPSKMVFFHAGGCPA